MQNHWPEAYICVTLMCKSSWQDLTIQVQYCLLLTTAFLFCLLPSYCITYTDGHCTHSDFASFFIFKTTTIITIIHLQLDTNQVQRGRGFLGVSYELEHDGQSRNHLTLKIDGLPVELVNNQLLQLCISFPELRACPVIWSAPLADDDNSPMTGMVYTAFDADQEDDNEENHDHNDSYEYESVPDQQSLMRSEYGWSNDDGDQHEADVECGEERPHIVIDDSSWDEDEWQGDVNGAGAGAWWRRSVTLSDPSESDEESNAAAGNDAKENPKKMPKLCLRDIFDLEKPKQLPKNQMLHNDTS